MGSDPVACSLPSSTPRFQTSTSRTPCGFSTSRGGSLPTSSGKRPTEISESPGLAGRALAPAGGYGGPALLQHEPGTGCDCREGPVRSGGGCYPAQKPGAEISPSLCALSAQPVARGSLFPGVERTWHHRPALQRSEPLLHYL